MNTNELFDFALTKVPKDVSINANWSYDIADRIDELMKERGMTQNDLAKQLNKSKSEVSRWLGGTRNFTLKTLALLSDFFGEPLILVNKGK